MRLPFTGDTLSSLRPSPHRILRVGKGCFIHYSEKYYGAVLEPEVKRLARSKPGGDKKGETGYSADVFSISIMDLDQGGFVSQRKHLTNVLRRLDQSAQQLAS